MAKVLILTALGVTVAKTFLVVDAVFLLGRVSSGVADAARSIRSIRSQTSDAPTTGSTALPSRKKHKGPPSAGSLNVR